ncbi:hypothetical protein AgCh_001643 [Apium graveolens]
MAESEATHVVPSSELLEWPKMDKRGFLHVMFHVGDLVRTIKSVVYCLIGRKYVKYVLVVMDLLLNGVIFDVYMFYTEGFGMKLLRKRDIPEEKYANAFLGFGPEESQFVVELT